MSVFKRGEFYHYKFSIDGETYRGAFNGKKNRPFAKTKKEATEFEDELKVSIRNGSYFQAVGIKNFGTFFDNVFMTYSKKHKASHGYDKWMGERLKVAFGKKTFAQIRPNMIEEFLEGLFEARTRNNKQFSPTTVRKFYNCINHVFNMAIRNRYANDNPCNYISKHLVKGMPNWVPRDRWLNKFKAKEVTDENGNKKLLTEEQRLFAEFKNGYNEHLADISNIILFAGLRSSEVLQLKKEHINLSREETFFYKVKGVDVLVYPLSLIVEKSKNGKPRVIPIAKALEPIFEKLIREETDYLFVNRNGGQMKRFIKAFKNAVERADIKDFHPHDLRHTFSTRLMERNIHPFVEAALMGHSTPTGVGTGLRVTQGYTHAHFDMLRAAIDSLSKPPIYENTIPRETESLKIVASA